MWSAEPESVFFGLREVGLLDLYEKVPRGNHGDSSLAVDEFLYILDGGDFIAPIILDDLPVELQDFPSLGIPDVLAVDFSKSGGVPGTDEAAIDLSHLLSGFVSQGLSIEGIVRHSALLNLERYLYPLGIGLSNLHPGHVS